MKKWYEEHKKNFYSGMGVFLFIVVMLVYAAFGTGPVKAKEQCKEQANQEENIEKREPVKVDVSEEEKQKKEEEEKEEKTDTEKEEKQEKEEEIKADEAVEKVAKKDAGSEESQDGKIEEKVPSSDTPTEKPSQGGTTGTGSSSSGNNSSVENTEKPSTPAQKPQEQPKPQEKPKDPVWHPPVMDKRWVVDQAAWDEVIQEPVYQMVEHTICSTCKADITGWAVQHLEESIGCGGYSSEWRQEQTGTTTHTIHHDEVGHWEEYVVQEGYWE